MDRLLFPNLRVLTPVRGHQIFAGGFLVCLDFKGYKKKNNTVGLYLSIF